MSDKLLISLAKAILSHLVGEGYWHRQGARPPRFEKPIDPILGLETGDEVYLYDSEKERVIGYPVITVMDDVGYVIVDDRYYGPYLRGISETDFGRTVDDAIESDREQIESDLRYWEDHAGTGEYLRSLLNRKESENASP